MNNRQKKKRFKKIYGMNPKQYAEWDQKTVGGTECEKGRIKSIA